MIKQTIGAGIKVGKQVGKESSNAKNAIKGLTNFLPEIWNTIVGCIPKMIRLTIVLIKSQKVSDRARLILSGSIFVIGFAIAEEFISTFSILGLATLLFGPITGALSLLFIKQIKLTLLAAAFFTIAHTFNTMVENDEVKKLSDELFGEKESDEFIADMQSMYQKLKKYFDPIADKLSSVFESIGKRNKKIDPESASDIVVRAAQKEMNVLIGWSGTSKAGVNLQENDTK